VTIALALALGAVIGAFLGLLGGGGSILAVPALVYVLGLGVEQAIPISLIVIGIASAAGAVPKVGARQVQWRPAGIFAAAGIPATFAGAAIERHLSPWSSSTTTSSTPRSWRSSPRAAMLTLNT
jgi:hypothetical protein